MTRISNKEVLTLKTSLSFDDYGVITDSEGNLKTRTFSFRDLYSLFGGGTPIIQNNLIPTFVPNGSRSGYPSVADAVNASSPLVVEADEVLEVVNSYSLATDLFRTTLKTDYYLLRVGAGTYGVGGTILSDSDFMFVRGNDDTVLESTTALPPRIIYIDTIDVDVTPEDIVNAQDEDYIITDDEDVFFFIRESLGTEKGLGRKIYRFVGAAGTYGLGNTDAVVSDFVLVNDFTGDSTRPTDDAQKITIREVIVGATIRSTGAITNIAEAVNNSFRGIISISKNEIVWFRVQRELAFSDGSKQLVTEAYAWNKGEGSISSDSVLSDYTGRIEREEGLTTEKTSPSFGDIVIIDVISDAVTNPSKGLNESTSVIVNNNDLYVKVTDELSDAKDPDYSLYRLTLGSGTYGSGGTATVDGDFELIENYREDIVGSDNPYTIKQVGDNGVFFESPLKQTFVGANATKDPLDGSSIITIPPATLPTANIVNSILVSIGGTFSEASIYKETLPSTSGTIVSVIHTPLLNTKGFGIYSTFDLYRNGVLQEEGVDFTLSGQDITFTVSLSLSDVVIAKYLAVINP